MYPDNFPTTVHYLIKGLNTKKEIDTVAKILCQCHALNLYVSGWIYPPCIMIWRNEALPDPNGSRADQWDFYLTLCDVFWNTVEELLKQHYPDTAMEAFLLQGVE